MKLQDYKLTEQLKTKIFTGIRTSKKYGISCLFVPINTRVGVKLFPRKTDRDFSFRLQKRLQSFDLSPKLGRSFVYKLEWPIIHDEYNISELTFDILVLYGFFTQRANTCFKNKGRACDILYKEAHKKGFIWDDSHHNNIGMIGKKLVIIDTDPASWSLT